MEEGRKEEEMALSTIKGRDGSNNNDYSVHSNTQ